MFRANECLVGPGPYASEETRAASASESATSSAPAATADSQQKLAGLLPMWPASADHL